MKLYWVTVFNVKKFRDLARSGNGGVNADTQGDPEGVKMEHIFL